MADLILSDGTILEVPDNATPDAIRAFSQRGEAAIKARGGAPAAPVGGPADDSIPVDLGFGLKTSMPNNMLTRGIRAVDQNVMAPLARGASSVPTMLYDLPATVYNWSKGEERMPVLAPKIQDALGMQPRDPADKSLTTDFLEMLGGGLGLRALTGAVGAGAQRLAPGRGPQRMPAAPQTLSDIAKTEVIGAAGATAGQRIGENYGGTAGGLVGSFAGGLTPTVTQRLLQAGVAKGLPGYKADALPETIPPELARTPGEVYDAAMRLGVRPTAGMVGSRAAASHETAAAAAPFGIGRPARQAIEQQGQQWGEALQNQSAALRGGPSSRLPTPESIGADIKATGSNIEQRYRAGISAEEEAIQNAIGPRTQVPIGETMRDIQNMRRETGTGLRSALGDVRSSLRESRDFNQPNAGRTRRQEIPYEVLRDERSAIGRDIAGNRTLPDQYTGRVYDSITRDLRNALDNADPALVQRFDDVTQRNARLSEPRLSGEGGDIPYLRKLGEQSDVGAFAQTFPGGDAAWERIAVLRRGDPQGANRIAADALLEMGAPTPGRRSGTMGFSPDVFLTNWNKFGPRAKLEMAGSMDAVRSIDDLATVAGAMRGRDLARNRSNTATAGAEMGFLNQLVTRPGRALANTGAGLTGSLGLTNQSFAAYLADRAPSLMALIGDRLAPSAARTATQIEEEAP